MKICDGRWQVGPLSLQLPLRPSGWLDKCAPGRLESEVSVGSQMELGQYPVLSNSLGPSQMDSLPQDMAGPVCHPPFSG